jgi:hypothetical protein
LVAGAWRDAIESADDWSAQSAPGANSGESAGYFVTCGPLNAYAKPSGIDASCARAAHEKIAADLAHDLGLPVPPAVLKRWVAPAAGTQPCVVLGLTPFFPVHKWAVVKAVPDLEGGLKAELRTVASAMVAFDTWIANQDRQNEGNLLISRSAANPAGPLHVAYIDFSYSLSHSWRPRNPGEAPDFKTVTPVGAYPIEQKDIDPLALQDLVGAIETLPEERIRSTVSRVPDDFLPVASKAIIIDGLLYRRNEIRGALKPLFGV